MKEIYKLFIVGRNGVGKDRLAQKLAREYKLNILCSHTDRPKRMGEINGIDHIYNTKEEFDLILENEKIIAYSESITEGVRYCSTLQQFNSCDIYIIDPKGIEYINQHYPDIKYYTIYITINNEEIRRERLRRRGDRWEEYQEKCKKENVQFAEFEKQKLWDVEIDNSGFFSSTYQLLINKIKELQYGPIKEDDDE